MMMFFGFLLIILIIWYIMKNPDAVKNLTETQSKNSAKEDALRILNEKFVNGEITEEEYLRKKKLIE
ncbi:membrane protein [Marinitoga sp. 1197]|nr:membrane protein [Marinitoga sp. 1197]